jgi:3-hydroxy acid dehydrogenase / malonic semialdehyde reductase
VVHFYEEDMTDDAIERGAGDEIDKLPVCLVTGASKGIGRAIALRMAHTHDIVAVARNEDALDLLAAEIGEEGGRCHTLVVDVSDPAAVAAALGDLRVDVLVNNAGVATLKPFMELTAAEWHAMVDVNLNALYHVTRAVLPGMMERGYGHVLIIGSTAGRNTFAGGTAYVATKHAVMGFAESLMLEVRDAGVKVSVVTPGSVATELFPPGTDTSWMIEPEDVAESVAYAVDTPPWVLVHRVEVRPLSPRRKRVPPVDAAATTPA